MKFLLHFDLKQFCLENDWRVGRWSEELFDFHFQQEKKIKTNIARKCCKINCWSKSTFLNNEIEFFMKTERRCFQLLSTLLDFICC